MSKVTSWFLNNYADFTQAIIVTLITGSNNNSDNDKKLANYSNAKIVLAVFQLHSKWHTEVDNEATRRNVATHCSRLSAVSCCVLGAGGSCHSFSQTVSQSVRHLVSAGCFWPNRVKTVEQMQVYNTLPPTLSHLLATVASCCFVAACHQKPKVDFFILSPELPHCAINCGHCESSSSPSTCEFSVENVNFTYATYFSRGLARLAF